MTKTASATYRRLVPAALFLLASLALPGQTLQYATFFGGEFGEQANGVALDGEGNVYIVGQTKDFAAAPGSVHIRGSAEDVFVLKLDPTLSEVMYLALFGGSARERGSAIAVDGQGAAYVTGLAFSDDFPTTPDALQPTFGGGTRDAFVAKLSPDGSRLEYSTYLGGALFEDGNAIRVDAEGAAYVAGATASADFQTTSGAYLEAQPAAAQRSAFLAKLSPDGSSLAFSTLLSGGAREEALALALDDAGKPWIAGYSASDAFPATPNAFQPLQKGSDDGFVARFSADGSALEAATLLGGAICVRPFGGVPCDQARTILIDGDRVIVGGDTITPDFPLAGASLQTTFGGGVAFGDAFAVIFDSELTRLEWSTYLGGSDEDQINSIVLDAAGDLFAAGTTGSADFPVTPNGVKPANRGLDEGFLVQIDPIAGKLLYSGLLGGGEGDRGYSIAANGRTLVVAGETASRGFPATPNAVQPQLVRIRNEGGDAYIAKFDFQAIPRFSAAGVVNAASFRTGALAPGEIISVFGRALGPAAPASLDLDSQGRVASMLAGVRLLINGSPAPLMFVSAGQINAVVPYGAAALPVVDVAVENNGVVSTSAALLTSGTAPALFTIAGLGTGQAAALNQDNSANSAANPVKRGEVIVLYGTGEGALQPAQPDGQVSAPPLASPASDISVHIGNADAEILYAGPAPGLVSGVIQINALVPPSVIGGSATPVSFTAGQARSPAGVTIAVE